MTYLMGEKINTDSKSVVPVYIYKKKSKTKVSAKHWKSLAEATTNLDIEKGVAGQITPNSNAFTFTSNYRTLKVFELIAGECSYIGREGIEFYPQELLIFQYWKKGPSADKVWLRNAQFSKSKYPIPARNILIEHEFLFPMVKGPAIKPFSHNYGGLIAAFPYSSSDPHRPIPKDILEEKAPLLLKYYEKNKELLTAQTKFSDKIRGPNAGEYYGLARTGPYSFKDVYVSFRDNTKWHAVVIEKADMPWGQEKRFVFQNHAVSICERKDKSGFIDRDEAHFVCAIFNLPLVREYIYSRSDDRSFKIRPPIFVPIYDHRNILHKKLSDFSKLAHKSKEVNNEIIIESQNIYLNICSSENRFGN